MIAGILLLVARDGMGIAYNGIEPIYFRSLQYCTTRHAQRRNG